MWEMREWSDRNVPRLLNQKLYDSSENPGHRANLSRYDLLVQFGGVYAGRVAGEAPPAAFASSFLAIGAATSDSGRAAITVRL